jgi:hypothetical protein
LPGRFGFPTTLNFSLRPFIPAKSAMLCSFHCVNRFHNGGIHAPSRCCDAHALANKQFLPSDHSDQLNEFLEPGHSVQKGFYPSLSNAFGARNQEFELTVDKPGF